MKTAIIYATHHGTTEMVAKKIQQHLLPLQVDLINLAHNKQPDISSYHRIVVGSSIHAGKNQSVVQKFCATNMHELLQKQVALYLCCLNEKEFEQSIAYAYPKILRNHAFSVELVGGEFKTFKMNFIERFLVKKIVGVTQPQSLMNHENINRLLSKMV